MYYHHISSEFPDIGFRDRFYTEEYLLSNGFDDIISFRNVINVNLDIDKVETFDGNWNPDPNGLNDVVYGRIEGVFANENGDTVRITEGQFKIREGFWKNPNNI